MSTNDFWSLVEKEKKKKFGFNYGLSLDNTPSGITPTGAFGELVKQYKFESSPYTATKDEDIAPVVLSGGGGMSFGENNTYFQDGPFADGYQFGDITKVILGTAADVSENVAEAVLDATENLIDTTAFGVGVVGGLFDKGFQDDVGEFIAKEPLTYKENGARLNALLNWTAPHGLLTHLVIGDKTEENSVLGEKADGLVQSGAHLAGSYGLQLVGVPAELTMGVNAYGSEIEHAYQNGASHTEAWISGSVAAGAEILFERLSSGVKILKGTTADEAATKALSRNISSRITRSVLKWLGDTAAEGGEEVLTDAVTSVARKLTYEDEKAWEEVFTSEDALDAFVGGAIIGGTVGGYKAVSANRAGVEYASGLTEAQEKAVRKIYDERIAEREASGEKLSALDKNKVWDSVLVDLGFGDANKLTTDEQTVADKVTEMIIAEKEKDGNKLTSKEKKDAAKLARIYVDKGYVKAETIESIFGGESYEAFRSELESFMNGDAYKALKEAEKNEKSLPELQKKYDELYKMENGKKSDEQADLQAELKKQIEAIKNSPSSADLKAQLDPEVVRINGLLSQVRNEVYGKVKNSRLAESYRELARRNEKFTVDVSKYTNEHARQTVQQIIDSGLGDNTNQFHDTVEFLARMSADQGVSIDLTDTNGVKEAGHYMEGYVTNGYVTADGKITLNYDSPTSLYTIAGHEITHVLEKVMSKESNAKFQQALFEFAKAKEGLERFNARMDAAKEAYAGKNNTTPEAEVAADLVGEYMFTDYEFIKTLARTDRNAFQRAWDRVKYMAKIAVAGSKEARLLEKSKHMFLQAYNEEIKGKAETKADAEAMSSKDVQHSLGKIVDENNHSYGIGVHLDSTLLDNLTPEERVGMVKEYVKELGGELFTAYDKSGNPVYVTIAKSGAKFKNQNGKRVFVNKDLKNKRINNEVKQEAIALIDELIVTAEFDTSKAPKYPHGWLDNNGKNDWEYWTTYIQDKNNTIWEATLNIANSANGEKILYDISPIKKVGRSIKLDTIPTADSVAQNNPDVNTQYSLSPVEAVEPHSDLWHRTFTTDEAKAIFPDMWNVAAEESGVRNPTQITSTVKSYRKVYDFLKAEGFDGTILDASSGLGYGTKAGIEEYGFNVEDIEPYPDSSYNPKYRDYSTLDKKYDAIISNAVLNVLPQDQRDALVVKMGELLNDGGRIFINVRGKDVESLAKTGKNIHLGNMEWIETVKGSYQKGFTKDELVAYLKDALGDGFTVEKTNMFGAVSAIVTKDSGVKYSMSKDSDGKELTKAQQDFFKDSKMRDIDGSLKPMYHGTTNGGFHEFMKDWSDDNTSFFFVDSNDVASSYSGTSEVYEAETMRSAEDMNKFLARIGQAEEYEVTEENGKFILLEDGDEVAASDTAQDIYQEFCDWVGVGYGDVNYKVYLNLKNPLEVDAQGKAWNALPSVTNKPGQYEYIKVVEVGDDGKVTVEYAVTGDTAPVTERVELFEKFDYGLADALANLAPGESLSGADTNPSTTRDYAQYAKENGYDGVIFKNIFDVGGYGINGASEATVAIAFDSNQIKSTANTNPTADPDIRFSLSKAVEETKDLVALHNLTAEKLLKSLELGGLPMPSIAITKADIPHDNFGEITLIMGKDTIDPKKNKKNVVYSADAWTPTFPQVEYEADYNVELKINSKLRDLATKVDDVFKHDIDMMRYGYEDNLNRYGGEEGLIQYAMDKYGFKAAYLEDQGKHIDKITKQVQEEKKYNSANEAKYQAVADILGVENASEIGKLNLKETIDQYGEQLEAIIPGITKTAMRTSSLLRQVQAYMEDQGGEPVYHTVTDESAMRKAVDDAIDMEDFEAWTRELFSGIVKDKGIYNNKDIFTPNGNRKSFKQTHLPFTLENIVKAMASQNNGNTKNVSGFNGIKTLRAGTAERFKSIEAMHERKGRLQHLTQAEADQINDDLSARLYAIMEAVDNENGNQGSSNSFIRFDSIGETLMEISEGGKYNVADIQGVFAKYRQSISDDLAADIKQLLFDVSQMPVNIYEAKPERAVTFDEVGVFVIPRNADVKLKQELLNRGYSIAEYDPDVEGDRQKVVNQFEEYKFSMAKDNGNQNPYGYYPLNDNRVYDPLAEFAPVKDTEIAPVAEVAPEAVPKTETFADMFPDDNTSIEQEFDSLLQQKEALENRMTEALNAEDYDAFAVANDEYNSLMTRIEELEAAESERFDALDDADVPPVRENGWLERADVVPLTKKAATDIARDVRQQLGLSNKQMYDVHMLIEEYSRSEFPDREQLFNEIKEKFGTYTESEFDETVKEAKSYLRTYGLFVSDSIKNEIADYRQLMRKNWGKIRFSKEGTDVDVLYHELNSQYPHLFPDDIFSPTDQFLQMVDVANMDAETKFEQELPDEVIWDVVDAVTNGVGEYRQTQREKAANKHSREAFNSLMKDADSYVPPVDDDIAPLPTTEPSVDEIAPTTDNVIPKENIAPVKADEPVTANERLAKKIANYENELANNQRLREESKIDYDNEIARLQAEYDAKKNKRSLSAHDLLRRIEQVKRMKNNVDADYAKRINDLGNRIEKLSTKDAKTAAQRQTKMAQHTEMWKELIGDTSTWKDMALGLSYKTKTLRRILRKVVRGVDGKPDIALADRIYDELETKYDHNEALLKRESRKVKAVFEKLNLNHAEDTYAHMLGELRHNPETTLTKDVVDEYYRKHKSKIDTKKVDTAITEARRTFDELIARVNTALREQGFKEIPYRKGYFPHFTNPKQGWLAKLLNWKTIDTEVPTSIAGLTETFTPQRSWQSFNKERKGDTTDYSLYQGLDTYIHGALDWIYHIDDLQSRRALENHIRYVHSEEGVKARIDEIKANEEYDADEAQALIDGVLAEANNPLSGLVRELMRRTNTLANKKAAGDRKIEDDTNRKIYSVMTNLNNRINANMVVGSFSSALTNFIPMVQSWHQVSPYFTVRGLGDYVRSVVRDDGMIEKSDFLTNRLMEEENLYQTGWDKVTDKAAWMMNVIDSITSNTVWRSKYLQNIKEGMSESQAIKDADQFAKNLMAGRSRGNMPTVFDEKNPFTKIFTAFQLEVANQYGYMFDDVVKDSKSPLRLVKGYATAFLGAYLYNALYSSLVGRDAAFDPIGIIEDLLRDLGVGDDDEEDDEDKVKDALFGFGENIVQEVPFIGGLVGGGRIPMSSALPYSNDSTPFQSIVNDVSEGNWSSFGKEFLKPLYYLAMPVGGGQLKKTVEGLSMFDDDLPVSGSYTGSGKLRFPVEKNLGNVVQAGLFGQYAGENARYYFDNDIAPLGEKQIQEYIDVDIPIRDYWDYRKGLKGKDTLGEKLAYIDKLDLPIRKQNILANNLTDRKEPIDMADWDKYDGLEEYNYAKKYPEKYQFLEANGISVEEYNNFDDDTKEAYSWAYQNPEKYTLSKAVAKDLMTYRKYASDLSDIKADKDEDGKSISGSRKDKVIEYINNMYADYGEKIILFKSEYPSDDTYNNDIVEYLNSREDISYEETVTILRELGFTVLDDGTVLWD